MIETIATIARRALLLVAFVLGGLAVWERLINHFGYTVLHGYAPSRLLYFAGVTLLFVIALQLRELVGRRV